MSSRQQEGIGSPCWARIDGELPKTKGASAAAWEYSLKPRARGRLTTMAPRITATDLGNEGGRSPHIYKEEEE